MAADIAEDPKPKEPSSAEIVPIMLDVPTTPEPKPDPDGSSVRTLQYVAIVSQTKQASPKELDKLDKKGIKHPLKLSITK